MARRKKKFEYAIRWRDCGQLYHCSDDAEYVRSIVREFNYDGLIVCRMVRREVGEWKVVRDGE